MTNRISDSPSIDDIARSAQAGYHIVEDGWSQPSREAVVAGVYSPGEMLPQA